jgi:tetratricopeptide (TPR) repeat protein
MNLRPRFASPFTLAAALSLASASARAQTATPTAEQPVSATPAAEEFQLTDAQRAEAAAALERGNTQFRRNNYEAALTEFLRVYEIAQRRANSFVYLFNIARCYERLFRYDQAIEFYQRYLDRAPQDDRDRAQATATVGALDGLLGTLEVQSNVADAQVWVDDRQVAERVRTVRIPGGVHVVELRARGYAPSRQQVQLPARTTQSISFRMERLNVRRGLHPAFFVSVASLGGATALTAAIVAPQVLAARAEVEALRNAPATMSSVGQDQKDRIRTLAIVTDVMLGVTIASAIGATLLGVATEWRRPTEAELNAPRTAARPRVTTVAPIASQSVVGVAVGGSL